MCVCVCTQPIARSELRYLLMEVLDQKVIINGSYSVLNGEIYLSAIKRKVFEVIL